MIEKVDTSREAVRKTGQAFLIAGTVIAAIIVWKHGYGDEGWQISNAMQNDTWKWFLGSGFGLSFMSYVAYPVFKPIHIGWMKLAFVLGWFMTRVILSVFYYLILTPIGLFLRITGKDLLDRKINLDAKSYWIKREQVLFDKTRWENQF